MDISQSKRTGIGLAIAQALFTAAGTAGLPAEAGAHAANPLLMVRNCAI